MLLEDGQELRLKHVRAISNKNTVQQIGIKYYISNTVAWKVYNIKCDRPVIQNNR